MQDFLSFCLDKYTFTMTWKTRFKFRFLRLPEFPLWKRQCGQAWSLRPGLLPLLLCPSPEGAPVHTRGHRNQQPSSVHCPCWQTVTHWPPRHWGCTHRQHWSPSEGQTQGRGHWGPGSRLGTIRAGNPGSCVLREWSTSGGGPGSSGHVLLAWDTHSSQGAWCGQRRSKLGLLNQGPRLSGSNCARNRSEWFSSLSPLVFCGCFPVCYSGKYGCQSRRDIRNHRIQPIG